MRRAVFLDRDGVLNEPVVRAGKPYPPDSVAGLRIYPEAARVCQALRDAGFLLIVVTNQPDVARGTQQRSVVDEMHARLAAEVPLDEILCCFHDDADYCACRKPKPGLILEGARRHGIDLARSFMVGDRWRDIDAGQAAGCRTIWIDRGYREREPSRPPDARVKSIAEAADWIVGQVV